MVFPERGSTVQIGPSACPNNCFRWSGEVGLDTIEGETNPNVAASFEMWFSLDGKEPISGDSGLYRLNGRSGIKMGQTSSFGSDIIRMFQIVPKYVLVKGRYQRSSPCPCPPGGNGAVVTGSTAFMIDYR